jgi:hypothetical protein
MHIKSVLRGEGCGGYILRPLFGNVTWDERVTRVAPLPVGGAVLAGKLDGLGVRGGGLEVFGRAEELVAFFLELAHLRGEAGSFRHLAFGFLLFCCVCKCWRGTRYGPEGHGVCGSGSTLRARV